MPKTEPTCHSDFVVYVDESGDHGLKSMEATYPVFVLAFCIFNKTEYAKVITPRLQEFKFRYFGHDMVVLHEHEIRKPKGPFTILFDADVRQNFMTDLTKFNSCGLQLADLVARPIGRKYLKPEQENRAYEVLEAKFVRDASGETKGAGLECYP